MDFKREAAERLRLYNDKKDSIINMEEDLRRLELEMTRIRSATTDSIAVSGGSSTREDAMVNNLAARGEKELSLEATRIWLRVTERALSKLDGEERLVLARMYINRERNAVSRLREELGLEDDRSVYRRKDKALRRFTILMYGRTEQ